VPDAYATIADLDVATQERLAAVLELRAACPALLASAGFEVVSSKSHGYLQVSDPDYMLTLVDRGADALASWGRIGPDLAASLMAEARRRAEADRFFGFIGFASVIARKAPPSR
jgi:hypothetical protein